MEYPAPSLYPPAPGPVISRSLFILAMFPLETALLGACRGPAPNAGHHPIQPFNNNICWSRMVMLPILVIVCTWHSAWTVSLQRGLQRAGPKSGIEEAANH